MCSVTSNESVNKCSCIIFCTRLLQHAAALRQLTHRNVAAVYDAFSAENCAADAADEGEQTPSFSVYIVQVTTQIYLCSVRFELIRILNLDRIRSS